MVDPSDGNIAAFKKEISDSAMVAFEQSGPDLEDPFPEVNTGKSGGVLEGTRARPSTRPSKNENRRGFPAPVFHCMRFMVQKAQSSRFAMASSKISASSSCSPYLHQTEPMIMAVPQESSAT